MNLSDNDIEEVLPDQEEEIVEQENIEDDLQVIIEDDQVVVDDLPVLLLASEETVDYSEHLVFIEQGIQVLNAILILIAVMMLVSGFIKIFNKFFCFDMI